MDTTDELSPIFSHAEPVLPVTSVTETVQYWQDVLAFPNKWTWGSPPIHGGVSWDSAFLQFSQNPERAKASAGNTVWVRVQHVDRLYKIHQDRKATIDEPLQAKDWGMDEYVVKEINGYYIVFAGHSTRTKKSVSLPPEVRILERAPSIEEFLSLAKSVGWMEFINTGFMKEHVTAPAFSVVAVDTKTDETIGCALLLTDASSFYYIKDVMVRPDWQSKNVGTALMKAISAWLDRNAVNKSLVGLYTGENLEPFYKQFGFGKAFGMVKRIAK